MSKKWKLRCMIGVVILLAALWVLRPQKLGNIVNVSAEDVHYATLYTYTDDEDWRTRRAEIRGQEAVRGLLAFIDDTEVRLDGLWGDTISWKSGEGEEMYSLRFYDEMGYPSTEDITFINTGRIYYKTPFYQVITGEDSRCTDYLEKLLQEYEVEP